MKGGISLVEPRELTEEEKQQLADLSPEFKERTEKKFKKLTITNDFIFSAVMRDKKYCKPFLERVLGFKIHEIHYIDYQKTIDNSEYNKSIRLDIYAEDENNTMYNVEMQTTLEKDLPLRTRYYQCALDLNLLEKGQKYRDLKESYIIFICTFDLYKKDRSVYKFQYRDTTDPSLLLGDDTTKVIINVAGESTHVSKELAVLLDYLSGKGRNDAFTRSLEEAVLDVIANRKWGASYMLLSARDEDKLEEGRLEGARKKEIEIVENMYDANLSIEQISSLTGIPIKEVEDILNAIPHKEIEKLDLF